MNIHCVEMKLNLSNKKNEKYTTNCTPFEKANSTQFELTSIAFCKSSKRYKLMLGIVETVVSSASFTIRISLRKNPRVYVPRFCGNLEFSKKISWIRSCLLIKIDEVKIRASV